MDYTSYNLINTKTSSSSSSSTPTLLIPSSYSRKPIIPRNGKHKASNKYITNNNINNTNYTNNNMNNKSKGRVRLSTDPQSVAARERRHRISDRFKMLQSLIPGGAKLDTVSMLDQAIQYVHFLKAQIKLHETIINNTNNSSNNNNGYNNNNNNPSNNHDDPTLAYVSNDNYNSSHTTVNDAYYSYYDQYCYALMNNNNNNNNNSSSNYHVSDQLQGGVGDVNGGFCYDQKMINTGVTPNQLAQIHNLWGYQEYGQQSIDYKSHLV